ncbi:MAG TPA: ABC transporter ATP-binding protein [Blastocatellia bacterium]|nr:ABC transporter ATP-binding protein [Blastocatellia bacterium]HMY71634.1 ABC transporter ATP-binding protein [Blastocatellia bacterium]HMZ19957.1 ABC transporter ATP-binding protein [Blastocatellia bacterium]HNG32777.1 ABC transporter ATP-binding protein [Blastocatellia bacterium]
MPILEAQNVTREYPMKAETVRALSEVSVAIERGEFAAILGTSGSGKSTLLNLFGGLDRPTSGEVLFDGKSLAPLSSREMSRYRLRSVGMIFQSFNLIPTMTARENVSLALAFAGLSTAARRRRSLELLDRVGLSPRADHLPSELSGGEQQRVSIARAIANEPQVLLADEPTGNLDSSRAAEVIGLLDEMRRRDGKTIVLITHDQELAHQYATKIVRLKDGRVLEVGV